MPIPDDLDDDGLLTLAEHLGAAARVATDPTQDPEIRAMAAAAIERVDGAIKRRE